MLQCLREGALVACEAVWAKTATAFQSNEKFRRAMADLAVTVEPLSEAAEAWGRCSARERGRKQGRGSTD